MAHEGLFLTEFRLVPGSSLSAARAEFAGLKHVEPLQIATKSSYRKTRRRQTLGELQREVQPLVIRILGESLLPLGTHDIWTALLALHPTLRHQVRDRLHELLQVMAQDGIVERERNPAPRYAGDGHQKVWRLAQFSLEGTS